METTQEFIDDLASRLNNRIQLSSDAFLPYMGAISRTFGHDVDYATIVKEYSRDPGTVAVIARPKFSELPRMTRSAIPSKI